MFKSNIAIRKRFVSDYNLPIPIVDDEDMFMYFLNLYEDDLPESAVGAALQNIFRTETGIRICKKMYGVDAE